jgi:uncharacterized repeat protein (TIGR03803 family)
MWKSFSPIVVMQVYLTPITESNPRPSARRPSRFQVRAIDYARDDNLGSGGIYNNGTIFKITPEGALTTLYSFCAQSGCADGEGPAAGLIQATNKALYGTTKNGGNNTACLSGGCGTIFKINLDGVLTTLHVFNRKQGASPGELIQATDGTLYGATYFGGANGTGTVFAMRPSGRLTLLHSFCAAAGICPDRDGAYPRGGLVQDTNGDLYGTTTEGGLNGLGTVFRLSVGLGPFVTTQTPVGSVGEKIVILRGTMSVTFNGIAAAFTVRKNRQRLEKVVDELEQERDLRERFVAALSHDLRTPLQGAIMCAHLIRRQPGDTGVVQTYAGRIIENISRAAGD